MDKRRQVTRAGTTQLVKRAKYDHSAVENDTSSNLQMLGHTDEVLVVRFSPSGSYFASAGVDKQLFLWDVDHGCSNFGLIKGSKGAILDLQWSRDSSSVYTCGSDYIVSTWDVNTGKRACKHVGHTDIVNAIDVLRVGNEIIASVGDDCSLKLWDAREKKEAQNIKQKYPLTAVAVSKQGSTVFTGDVSGQIVAWDLRSSQPLYTLNDSSDIITSLAISPDGTRLLSNSRDSIVRTFNIQPFAPATRLLNTATGAMQGHEHCLTGAAWNHDASLIASGSADRSVYVWDDEGQLKYQLPGHEGSVTHVDFHPQRNAILSCSTDKTILLGELQ
ncbi:splicing factor Spf38 [Schizosaccharomyces japonicus yFS275]|uniref:Splicing factor Spf38 n=1 Tax=Schizosaccharomyces japonicus (strain yFS275 / FY16936) TaxID=402676 RepID=B6JXY0_SCHJY|nr:splicing factor Spf38 [Schizosaccharomyces japonicus yFS275]EEB06398.1 splicing factor Spf38 [Schizosaccharomyces japonicus yFS275]